MPENSVVEVALETSSDQSILHATESNLPDDSTNKDAELLALADEYSGIVFEWGSYKGTSHEIIARCPWARQAGSISLRSIFELGAESQKEKEAETKEAEEKPEDIEEVNKEIIDGPEQKSGAEKAEQKPIRDERTDQRTSEKKADGAPEANKQIASQNATNLEPVKAAAANEALATKPSILRARESSLESPPDTTVSSPSPRGIKANTVSIPEMSQDTVKATHPTTETGATGGGKPIKTVQKTPALSVPELAKNTHLGGQKIEEVLDETLPPEAEDEVSLIERGQAGPLAEDEDRQISTADINNDFFLEEIVNPEAEVFLEDEPAEAEELWGNDEVLHLRGFGAEGEIDAEPVVFMEIDSAEIAEDLQVKEIEQTVKELVERIEAIDAEKTEAVFEILDKITLRVEAIIAPLQTKENGQEDDESGQVKLEVVEAGAAEELRELFIELFDYVGMEYAPELIDAFIKLALKIDILKLIPKTELVEKSFLNSSQGTHEIIKQLLGALTAIKQAAERAYAIGKSVLLLYRRQLASA